MASDRSRPDFLELSLDYPPEPLFGMGVHVEELAGALAAQGVGVTVVTRNRSGEPEDVRTGRTSRVLRCPAWWDREFLAEGSAAVTMGPVAAQLSFCRRMYRRLAGSGLRAGVVHNHGQGTTPLACELSELWGVPLVSTVHVIDCMLESAQLGSRPRSVDRWTNRALEAEGLKRSDVIAVPSTATGDAVAGEYPEVADRIHVLPHPRADRVPVKTGYAARRPFRILCVGRLISYKGVAELLEAIGRLPAGTIECWVVGRGVQEAELRRHPGTDRQLVRWLGQLPHDRVLRLYARADALVVPSVTETYGMALQEGLQAGLPVVAADLDSYRDRLEHGVNGLVVPVECGPGGSRVPPSDLAAAIGTLRADEGLRRRLGRNASRSAEKYPAAGEYAEALLALVRAARR